MKRSGTKPIQHSEKKGDDGLISLRDARKQERRLRRRIKALRMKRQLLLEYVTKLERLEADSAKTGPASLRLKATLFLEYAENLERLEADAESEDAERDVTEREDTEAGLPGLGNTVTLDGMNTESWSHALKIAHGKAKDALAHACVWAGMTQGEMVEKVRLELKLKKLPLSGISQARRGTRPIRSDVADAIQRLTVSKRLPTGFRATKTNWPGGIRDVSRRD